MNNQPKGISLFPYVSLVTVYLLFFPILMLSVLIPSRTCFSAMKKEFIPRISVYQQYDHYVDLYEADKESLSSTRVAPGFILNFHAPATALNLDYQAEFLSDENNASSTLDNSQDSTRHQGKCNWSQQLNPRLSMSLSETFITSEDRLFRTEREIEEVMEERHIYYRNNGKVTMSYKFGEEDQISVGYSNLYLDGKAIDFEDSLSHEGFATIDTWLVPQFGVSASSSVNRGTFEGPEHGSKDFYEYQGGLVMRYRWRPSYQVYLKYDMTGMDFDKRDTDGETRDYWVHQGALGVTFPLSLRTNFSVEGGYFFQDFVSGRESEGSTYNVSLATSMERGSINLGVGGGYDQDYFTLDNQGSSKFFRASCAARYLVTKHLNILGSLTYHIEDFYGEDDLKDRREDVWQADTGFSYSFWEWFTFSMKGIYINGEYQEITVRKDDVWRGEAGFSITFWRWLTLSMEGRQTERKSSDPEVEFRDSTFFVRLTGAHLFLL